MNNDDDATTEPGHTLAVAVVMVVVVVGMIGMVGMTAAMTA